MKIFGDIPLPLAIVTAGGEFERAGVATSWFTLVSRRPPYIGVAIHQDERTLELILKYREFAVNLVSRELLEAALSLFRGKEHMGIDKFSLARELYKIKVRRGKRVYSPVLEEAPVVYECLLAGYHMIGDHYLVIGEPITVYRNHNGPPVVLVNGRTMSLGTEIPLA